MKGKKAGKTGTSRVFVTLKQGVLDPQGQAVQSALVRLGFPEVADVRIGKVIEISLLSGTSGEDDPDGRARLSRSAQLTAMCERLLANPVIEDFRIETDDDE